MLLLQPYKKTDKDVSPENLVVYWWYFSHVV